MNSDPQLVAQVLGALASAIDPTKLEQSMQAAGLHHIVHPSSVRPSNITAVKAESLAPSNSILGSLVLEDVLDDAILTARPGNPEYPLRALLSELAQRLGSGEGLAFAAGLNFYFRQQQADEEIRLSIAIEVSRAFYRFAEHAQIDAALQKAAAPLLAQLLSTELARATLEAVDDAIVFDSSSHERAAGSDAHSARILGPRSFLARATQSQLVKKPALVLT
jgi:hypothetical protein